jgi:hypothetical protein
VPRSGIAGRGAQAGDGRVRHLEELAGCRSQALQLRLPHLEGVVRDAIALLPGAVEAVGQVGVVRSERALQLAEENGVGALPARDAPARGEEYRRRRFVRGNVEEEVAALRIDRCETGARVVLARLRQP